MTLNASHAEFSRTGTDPLRRAPRPEPGATQPLTRSEVLRRILSLSVPVTVSVAERDISIESLLQITVGTILEFEVPFDSDLTLYVADQPIGKGHAVKVGENFGLRITQIDTVQQRVRALHDG